MNENRPVPGRIIKAYSTQTPYVHYAPSKPGRVREPVRAVVAGTVQNVVNSRKPGQTSEKGKVVRGGISGNGCEILAASGDRAIYGHVRVVVEEGSAVNAGDVIGYTDRSGFMPRGPMLFFAICGADGKPRNPATATWQTAVEDEAAVRDLEVSQDTEAVDPPVSGSDTDLGPDVPEAVAENTPETTPAETSPAKPKPKPRKKAKAKPSKPVSDDPANDSGDVR